MNTEERPVMTDTYHTADVPPQEMAGRPGSMPLRPPYYEDPRRKSPVLALVLSLMPGLGQIYLGYYQHGFVNVFVVAAVITMLATNTLPGLEPLLGLFIAFFWMYNMVDAWRRAVYYNNALAGIGPATVPDDFGMPKSRGTLFGGAILVAMGLVLLSNTLFRVSLDWVEDWWPAALIVAGIWLAYPQLAERFKTPKPPNA